MHVGLCRFVPSVEISEEVVLESRGRRGRMCESTIFSQVSQSRATALAAVRN